MEKLADKKQADILKRFFKTGPGQYGEGDIFLGIKVPVQRGLGKKYKDLGLREVEELLCSKIHEHRMIALFMLIQHYKRSDDPGRKKIYSLYLKNTKNINNWDLVDLSAPNIIGNYLLDKDRAVLLKLARSKSLWERRIAMLATFEFIKQKDVKDAFKIAEILLNDEHDLIHKAVGWMLREAGKRAGMEKEEEFLQKHYRRMPRTMLRYAIERMPEGKRKMYLDKS